MNVSVKNPLWKTRRAWNLRVQKKRLQNQQKKSVKQIFRDPPPMASVDGPFFDNEPEQAAAPRNSTQEAFLRRSREEVLRNKMTRNKTRKFLTFLEDFKKELPTLTIPKSKDQLFGSPR